MKAIYWQLVTRCEEKYTAWRPALEWLGWALVKMARVYGTEAPDVPDDMVINVENVYPLIEDEEEEKALDMAAVNAGVMSRAAYIKKWGKDVSDDDAMKELRQIQLERHMLEDGYAGDMVPEAGYVGGESGGA